jgi:hypothetical protein
MPDELITSPSCRAITAGSHVLNDKQNVRKYTTAFLNNTPLLFFLKLFIVLLFN